MRREWIVCGLLAALTVTVYWPLRHHDFVCYDEFAMILQNPLVLGGVTLRGLFWALTTSWFEYWHPVTWLSHMLDCELFGPNPGCHHLVSVALHALNALLGAVAISALIACVLLTLRQIGFWKNSVTLFEHAVEVTPDNPVAQCNLGYGLFLEGKPTLAAVRYRAALAINPRYAQAHFNLAGLLKDQERWPEAAEHYLATTRLRPDLFLPHLALAQILPRLGRTKDAAFQMEEFLRTCPSSNLESPNSPILEPALIGLNDLAWLLATSERSEDRDGGRAVRFAERACALTQFKETILVGTLAAAYADAGRFPEAVSTAERACALAAAANNQPLLERNQQLLTKYRIGQPCREPAPRTSKDSPAR